MHGWVFPGWYCHIKTLPSYSKCSLKFAYTEWFTVYNDSRMLTHMESFFSLYHQTLDFYGRSINMICDITNNSENNLRSINENLSRVSLLHLWNLKYLQLYICSTNSNDLGATFKTSRCVDNGISFFFSKLVWDAFARKKSDAANS